MPSNWLTCAIVLVGVWLVREDLFDWFAALYPDAAAYAVRFWSQNVRFPTWLLDSIFGDIHALAAFAMPYASHFKELATDAIDDLPRLLYTLFSTLSRSAGSHAADLWSNAMQTVSWLLDNTPAGIHMLTVSAMSYAHQFTPLAKDAIAHLLSRLDAACSMGYLCFLSHNLQKVQHAVLGIYRVSSAAIVAISSLDRDLAGLIGLETAEELQTVANRIMIIVAVATVALAVVILRSIAAFLMGIYSFVRAIVRASWNMARRIVRGTRS